MINGHEKETQELSAEELLLATNLIDAFKGRTKDNPIKAKEIVEKVNKHYQLKTKFTDVRLRKIVNYYRTNSIIPIISGGMGYYVSYEPNRIVGMIKSLGSQVNSLNSCIRGMQSFIDGSKVDYVCNLSEEDADISEHLLIFLKKFYKANPIKSFDIVNYWNNNFSKYKFTDVRLRMIVNHYRINGIIPIISTSNGYFVSYLNEDIEAMIISLSQRAKSITDCCDGLQRILDNNN